MKAFKIYAAIAMIAAALLSSCREDTLKVYDGDNYVHFTPDGNDTPTAEYNFAYGETTRETEAEVPVEIRLWGYLPSSDFRCRVSVAEESTTASAADYELPEAAVFRAGRPADTLWIKVRRKPELLATSYRLSVKMDGADGGHVVGPSSYSVVTVRVTDAITAMPAWWNTTQALGEYSPMKYRVFNIYLGKVLQNLDGYTNMEFSQEARDFRAWWAAEWEKGNYRYYAPDGTTPLYETIPE